MNGYSQAQKVGLLQGGCAGCCVGLLLFVFSIPVTLFLPCIGWVVGPIMFVLAFVAPFLFLNKWTGACPVCGNGLEMTKSVTCSSCKSRVVRGKHQNQDVFSVFG